MLTAEVAAYIARVPRVGVDPQTLTRLAEICAGEERTLLLGYNDYAKHLINLFGPRIAGVVDGGGRYVGTRFREVPVIEISDWRPCEQVLVCEYSELFAFKRGLFERCLERDVAFRFAEAYGKDSAKVVDFVRHDPLYQAIFREADAAPASMLSEPGLFMLLELLRACLNLEGQVADVGAWQGGSAWFMAKLLDLTGADKKLFVFDKGEELPATNPQAVVGDEQVRSDLAFYEHAVPLFGNVVHTMQELDAERFAFVFIDFGWTRPIVEFFYDRLATGGILLLDNYGHTLGNPDQFDRYFEELGVTVIRQFRSPVGFVLKRPAPGSA